MYTLLSGLYRSVMQKDEYSILILGLDNAGKSTYLEQAKAKFVKNYKSMNLNKITSTVGLNIGQITVQGVKLNFWDLGGQEELQSLWDKYYSEAHAVIYMIDSSDQDRLEESREAFEKMISSQSLEYVPLLMLANKQDLEGSLSSQQIKEVFHESSTSIGHRDCHFRGVSALKGDGVNDGILWVVEKVIRSADRRPPIQKDIT